MTARSTHDQDCNDYNHNECVKIIDKEGFNVVMNEALDGSAVHDV